MGYGYKKVKGEYPEKDEKTGKKKTVSEPSLPLMHLRRSLRNLRNNETSW